MTPFDPLGDIGLVEPDHLAFAERMHRFAERTVAPTVDERARARRFDRDLWRQLAGEGFASVLVPEERGGAGRDARSLVLALDALVEHGHDLGLGVSLNVQNQVVRYLFLDHATAAQRERYLPGLLAGDTLICLAVSEPERGAHPKHLQTRADRDGETYVLTGHKAYITNGPESDLMIVVAVTDDSGPRRGISAFLVERDWPGVDISPPMDLGFLPTSPHAEVRFERTPVPAANLFGLEGEAWAGLVRGFRDHEDAFGCGLMSGLLAWQLRETLAGAPGEAAAAGGDCAAAIADAQSALVATRLAGLGLAALRDAGRFDEDAAGILLDAHGAAFQRGIDAVDRAWAAWPVADDAPIHAARRDTGIAHIAGRVRTIRRAQRGARLAQASRKNG